jgi:hypothetical protein
LVSGEVGVLGRCVMAGVGSGTAGSPAVGTLPPCVPGTGSMPRLGVTDVASEEIAAVDNPGVWVGLLPVVTLMVNPGHAALGL